MTRASAALTLLLTVACASTPLTSSSSFGGGAGTAPTLPALRSAPDYIVLSAPNQIRSWDFGNPVGVRSLHVRGVATTAGFRAIGEVQGNGKFCSDATHWLSLADLTVYRSSEKAPQAPYIAGCANGTGFRPSSRTITAE